MCVDRPVVVVFRGKGEGAFPRVKLRGKKLLSEKHCCYSSNWFSVQKHPSKLVRDPDVFLLASNTNVCLLPFMTVLIWLLDSIKKHQSFFASKLCNCFQFLPMEVLIVAS